MSLLIKNRQRMFPVNVSRLRSCALCMQRAARVPQYELSIRLTTDPVIRSLNAQLRNQPHATDVLSIAPHRTFPPALPAPLAPGVLVLGEIVMSVQYVSRHGAELGSGLMQRLERLLAHGLCHLLGYDHERDEDYELMNAREEELMAAWREEQQRQKQGRAKRTRRTKAELQRAREEEQSKQRGMQAELMRQPADSRQTPVH